MTEPNDIPALGTACTTTAVLVATRRRGQPARQRWLPALGLVAAGGIAIAAALDKIRQEKAAADAVGIHHRETRIDTHGWPLVQG